MHLEVNPEPIFNVEVSINDVGEIFLMVMDGDFDREIAWEGFSLAILLQEAIDDDGLSSAMKKEFEDCMKIIKKEKVYDE